MHLDHRFARGLGLIEVVIATVIAALCSIPIIWMVSSARTDTGKAIHYLRAIELANEAIEWAQLVDFARLDELKNGGDFGSLVQESGSGFSANKIFLAPPTNSQWAAENLAATDLRYSEQYNKAFFYRSMEVEKVGSSVLDDAKIRKVTVTVEWNEGKKPDGTLHDKGRMRKITLRTLIVSENPKDY